MTKTDTKRGQNVSFRVTGRVNRSQGGPHGRFLPVTKTDVAPNCGFYRFRATKSRKCSPKRVKNHDLGPLKKGAALPGVHPASPFRPPTKKEPPPQGQLLAKNFRDVSLDQISSTRTLVRWIVAVSPCLPMLNSRRPLLSSFSFISNSKTKVCHSVVRSIEVSGK